MPKIKKCALIVLCPILIVLWLHLCISDRWYGFGIDSNGKLYVGEEKQIAIYSNGQLEKLIPIPQNRSYFFTVQGDDTILLATATYAFVLDLNGNLLNSEPDPNGSLYFDLQSIQEVKASNGNRYYHRKLLGRRIIERNDGEIIYKTPLSDYFASIANSVPIAAVFVISILYTRENIRKKR